MKAEEMVEKMIKIASQMKRMDNDYANGLISAYGYRVNKDFLMTKWESLNAKLAEV